MEVLEDIIPNEKKHILKELEKDAEEFFVGAPPAPPVIWKDYRFIPGFEPETAEYAYNVKEFEENCVLVATFIKTGTTWTMEIVRNILYGHDEKLDKISKSLSQVVTYLASIKAKKYEATDLIPLPRRLYGTHLPAELVNVEKIKRAKGKFIFVERNPKDQAVSLFHFLQNPGFEILGEELHNDWPTFFEKYVSGKLSLMTKEGEWYPDYLIEWNKYRKDESFLFLCFEDLKKDIRKEIRRIAKFLDVALSEKRIEEIAENTSFGAMKKSSEVQNPQGLSLALKKLNMMRKGEVGSWKNVFTVAQSEIMDKIIEEKLSNTEISFKYEL